jgi:histidine triad (HIT) family protein
LSCIFCRIVAGEVPAAKVHEDADVLAFRDVRPQAPSHVLVVPKRHIASLHELDDARLAGALLLAAVQVAQSEELEQGWRLIANTRAHGGQEVEHLHLHVLGGRALGRMLAPVPPSHPAR